MNTQSFKPLGEVTADDRGRIAFGKAGVRRDDRYAIAVSGDGEILLTPLATVPRRELLVWEDQQLRSSLAAGLEQSAIGETENLGDFTQFLEESDDEESDEDN